MSVPNVHNELLTLSSPLKYLDLAPVLYIPVLRRHPEKAWKAGLGVAQGMDVPA